MSPLAVVGSWLPGDCRSLEACTAVIPANRVRVGPKPLLRNTCHDLYQSKLFLIRRTAHGRRQPVMALSTQQASDMS
jgi:hypothetical protein